MTQDAATIKSCCAAAYASPWVSLVLGEYWHPGGAELTVHLGGLLALGRQAAVGDVACGAGATARLLARRFGCAVDGVDYGAAQIAKGRQLTRDAGLEKMVTFTEGDAESLPWAEGSLDAVVCECALCTFPDAGQAVAEWHRVLRPGGRVGLTDVTRRGPLPAGLDDLAAWVACLGGARSLDSYHELLSAGGFDVEHREDRSRDLAALVERIGRAVLAWLDFQGPKEPAPALRAADARRLLADVTEAIRRGNLGYALLTARRRE